VPADIVLLVANCIFSQHPVEKLINNPLLQNANISLLVKDLKSGETLYELRPKNSAVTASTMKVITTATALEMFGPDFRFETKLEIDGETGKDSTLNGNLYIRGGGDPTLGSDKMGDKNFLTKWINAVKKQVSIISMEKLLPTRAFSNSRLSTPNGRGKTWVITTHPAFMAFRISTILSGFIFEQER